jgi:hypothetical protein
MAIRDGFSDVLFPSTSKQSLYSTKVFERSEYPLNSVCSQLVDAHFNHGLQIHYLLIQSSADANWVTFRSNLAVTNVREGKEFGIVLQGKYKEGQYAVWCPADAIKVRFDTHQRIEHFEADPPSHRWDFSPHFRLHVLQPCRKGEVAVIPCMVFQDPDGQHFEEVSLLSGIESRFYSKSRWFHARYPADIWNYLINGSLYDPRSFKSVGKRFKCQQCAYSWWSYFNYLHITTGKKQYLAIRDEIAFSVFLDMSPNGEWGHGFWSDQMETHTRFHMDGVHLLISQYEKSNELMWLETAERGMAFVTEHLMDRFDDGTPWFLHDTIEHNNNNIPHRFKSTLFGKSPGNSLCINTHVQTLTVLWRLVKALPDKSIYDELFETGARALQRVLTYQPGEIFHKPIHQWIKRHKKRKREASSIFETVRNGVESRFLRMVYWMVMRQFPRIVHTNGFIERDLTLSFAPDSYHIWNLKDFLVLYRLNPLPWLRPYIQKGLDFVMRLIQEEELTKVLGSGPYCIELMDILYLYNRRIERLSLDQINFLEERIYEESRGYSLDYFASELVRDISNPFTQSHTKGKAGLVKSS